MLGGLNLLLLDPNNILICNQSIQFQLLTCAGWSGRQSAAGAAAAERSGDGSHERQSGQGQCCILDSGVTVIVQRQFKCTGGNILSINHRDGEVGGGGGDLAGLVEGGLGRVGVEEGGNGLTWTGHGHSEYHYTVSIY